MKYLNYSFLFIILLLSSNAHAQKSGNFRKYYTQGEYFYSLEQYDEALRYFTMLLEIDPDNYHILYLTGECYLNLPGRKSNAIPYLEKAIEGMTDNYRDGSYRESKAPNETLYSLARAYHINSQYSKAHDFYVQYRQLMTDRSYADYEYVNKQIEACLAASQMMAEAGNVEFVPVGADYSLASTGYNPVVSSNDSIMLFMNDEEARRTIYLITRISGRWSEPIAINSQLGAIDDCLITGISSDGKELYMTRTDNIDSDIYVSHYINGGWTKIISLKSPVNTAYFESHASLSGDGKTLYFTSNRRGGYGALEIYRVERVKQDEWGKLENLGETINTAYNEESPFVTADGKRLYFSSQGHETMGGYDVFYCNLQPDGSWSYPKNLGYPLNSGDDEVFYVPVNNGKDGIMASARGKETQGIYRVRYLSEEEVAERNAAVTSPVNQTTPEKTVQETSTYRNLITVKNIMFDYKSFVLNEQGIAEADNIFRIMRDFPDITLEVTGHTDSKGSEEYNMDLSRNRARAVTSYLENKGITTSRLIARGVGESDCIAINENPDGSDNPEGRQLNRHARIRFLNFENLNITVEEINVPEHLRPLRDLEYSVLLAEKDTRDTGFPPEILQTKVREIETGHKYLYLAGIFPQRSDAVVFLNQIVDEGYPGASVIEKRELDRRISLLSGAISSSAVPKHYTIQIMALKNGRDASWFSNLPGVKRVDGSDGLYRYIYGDFESISAALEKLPEIKALGYRDAFIMNMKNYQLVHRMSSSDEFIR